MSITPPPRKFEFQAEIKQLLDIVVNSLYTEREIFVRELVSNASDALEKLRHLQITETEIHDSEAELEIEITTDEQARTLTIQDSGVGMSELELRENIGTIASSGSKKFAAALADQGRQTRDLIGQFGVGFYSVFMVAQSVTIYTRSWRPTEDGRLWSSEGAGVYTTEPADVDRRGSKVVIQLKEGQEEFSKEWRIREIIQKYSAFVSFPISLNGKRINTVPAIWLRQKNGITEEEYTEFYRFQAHAYDNPRLRLHFRADAPLTINTLLFVPQENPEKLGLGRIPPGVALYSRRILIDGAPKELLPEWLRFVKGVVESEDIPLNISRESMQDRALLEKIRKVLTNRFLKMLEDEASARPAAYDEFYGEFGAFLKEGAFMDATYRDSLGRLLRFESSSFEKGKLVSLPAYVSRMPAEQKEIFFLVGPNRECLEAGPYLEGFKARNVEILFCYESVDEYVINHLREFDGKRFISADQAEIKLPELTQPAGETALGVMETNDLCTWIKDVLGSKVNDVRSSDRLVDSPAVALNAEPFMAAHLRRRTKSLIRHGSDVTPPVILDLNPRHSVIVRLYATMKRDPDRARLMAEQILDNALLAAGLMGDTTAMVRRLYKILNEM